MIDWDPDDPEDGRVLCWYCKHWSHHTYIGLRQRMDNGAMVTRKVRVRCCKLVGPDGAVLAYDPLILRWCLKFKALPPRERVRLPSGAFPSGWQPAISK